ncbi:MAG TPA: NfeD family protein [Pyrinomonadaceae bacterium]|nr:NfeD family protein [Pyrinomonadaceae bacterium]
MKLLLLVALISGVSLFATGLVIALYRHKKARVGDVKLIGEMARVHTKLDPEGAVIVCGELWRARSKTGETIPAGKQVVVIGFEHHLALVEVCD